MKQFVANFKITEMALQGLGLVGVPTVVLEILRPMLNHQFKGEEQFLAQLKTQIGDEQIVSMFKSPILKYAEWVAEVTDSDWETQVLGSDRPVLVDFWAAWCGPCRMLAPTIEQVAEKYQGKAKIVKLNVDENPDSPGQYGIRGIPTLILFNRGQEVDRHVGVPPNALATISQMIEKQL